MNAVDTVVIGAGHAGLAMSAHLAARGRDHVVLDRGRTAERWRSERWDSLRLLTPNWMTRLPGYDYRDPDPDGYMTAAELAGLLNRYAAALRLPVMENTAVRVVEAADAGYRIVTDGDTWSAANVVVATGACDAPAVPAIAAGLHPAFTQIPTSAYRNPAQLPPGGVLVVGASASGLQIADELRSAGREVVLATGSHTGCPAATAGWTSCGGWRPSAPSTAASTTCPTRSAPAANRRCSWWAAPTPPTWTWEPSTPRACR